MSITIRAYDHSADYARVSELLIRRYQPHNHDGNWLEPAWEYMHYHPLLDPSILPRFGLWEDGGRLVAAVHPEFRLGEAFFQVDPAYRALRAEMIDYAEQHLAGPDEDTGETGLTLWINDNDPEFQALAQSRGYAKTSGWTRPMAIFEIPDPFPPISLPKGFTLTSLAEEPDWAKVHRVMWRGFDHDGEPPAGEDELESRRAMFDTLTARRDLKIAVKAPAAPGAAGAFAAGGLFAAFCGMFYQPDCRYAYVEPVATDPDFRRMGLGRAAVLEGIRRCAALGATVAYVGSDQPFYQSLGFRVLHRSEPWRKVIP